jgi:hypothetical protein
MNMNRRDFTKLSMAVFGGVVAGTVGCGKGDQPQPVMKPSPPGPGPVADASAPQKDLNVCRGLNACKGQGKGGDNACAGQGQCATAKAHDCGTLNDCKYQGGCNEKPGANDCKGMGGCHVPLASDDVWQKARTLFEERMKAQGKEVGKAPPKAEG